MSTWILLVSLLLNGTSASTSMPGANEPSGHEGSPYPAIDVYLGKRAFERALKH